MLLRVIFLILFSQTFMKQLVCSLESKGTYFKRVSDMPNSVANDENFLSLKLFSCGRDNECSNVVESQLGKMKGKGTVWSKVKEPEFILISKGKGTRQSTTYSEGVSSRAVDGNKDGNWAGNSCTHSGDGLGGDVPHWWRVDFARRAMINKVEITNRSDCCSNRLRNFTIRIGFMDTSNVNPICREHVGISTGITVNFKCNDAMPGRYLYIESHSQDALTLCEVQVYGYYF